MCKSIEELCEDASAKAFEKGIEEGIEKQSITIARELLKIGEMTPEMIAQVTHLPFDTVLALC